LTLQFFKHKLNYSRHNADTFSRLKLLAEWQKKHLANQSLSINQYKEFV